MSVCKRKSWLQLKKPSHLTLSMQARQATAGHPAHLPSCHLWCQAGHARSVTQGKRSRPQLDIQRTARSASSAGVADDVVSRARWCSRSVAVAGHASQPLYLHAQEISRQLFHSLCLHEICFE